MRVLLAVNFNHDGAGVLLVDGAVAGYVCTERYSRLKKHPGMRESDLDELFAQAGITASDVDHVLLCNLNLMDSPDVTQLHGSDLKDTWFDFWTNGRQDTVRLRGRSIPCTINPDHHLLHAAAPFFTSGFDSAVVLAIDPTGCRAYLGSGNRLLPLALGYDSWFTANIGYAHVAHELFGSGVVGAGKVMGLAPYGDVPGADVPPVGDGRDLDFAGLVRLAAADPVPVQVGERTLNARMAHLIQLGLERQLDAVLADLADVAARNGVGPDLCLSGGTALNAVANQACFARSRFERLHLHPACGDDGTAIGAVLWFWHHVLGNPRRHHGDAELMYGIRTYSDDDVRRAVDAARATHPGRLHVTPTPDTAGAVADLLVDGAIVGFFDGASEVGPRALGHRSILADPRSPTVQHRLNARVKHRELFRPFAPAVLAEHGAEWFDLPHSPFMLRACPVLRPGLPAITHVDGTSRIQTVTRSDTPGLHGVLEAFRMRTGTPLVLNTSLNTAGRPIDETPADALSTLLACELTHLAFPGLVISKAGRPALSASG